jgi:membrane-associated protein
MTKTRRERRLDAACAGGMALGVALSYAATFLTPTLLAHHPVVLELMGETTTSMVTAGALVRIHRLALLLALGAPLLGSLLLDPFWWWAGRRFAEPLLSHYRGRGPRWARWVDRSERLVARYGVWALVTEYYLPVPTGLIQVLAGSAGLPLAVFVLADLAGTLLWVGLLVGLGWAVGHPAVRIADSISHDGVLLTVAVVELTVLLALRPRPEPVAPTGRRLTPTLAGATVAAAVGAVLGRGYLRQEVTDLLWPLLVGVATALALRAPRSALPRAAAVIGSVGLAALSAVLAGRLGSRPLAGLAGRDGFAGPVVAAAAGAVVGLALVALRHRGHQRAVGPVDGQGSGDGDPDADVAPRRAGSAVGGRMGADGGAR